MCGCRFLPLLQVTRAAEECAGTLANSIPPEQCIRVLNPIIQTADYPVNLAAIKMQTKVVENMTKDLIDKMLPDVIPGLLKVRLHLIAHYLTKK